MAGSDDRFSDDPEANGAGDEFDRLQMALLDRIEEFINAEDLGESDVVDLLISSAVHLRMVAYGMNIEKPSAGGLKLDLDRFRQDFDQLIRGAKKGADGFVEQVKEARARAEGEPGGK